MIRKRRMQIAFTIVALMVLVVSAKAGKGVRLYGGYTQVANGDFYKAMSSGSSLSKGAGFFGAGFYAGTPYFEYEFSWNMFSLQSNASPTKSVTGTSNQFMVDLSLRPLELGTSGGLPIVAGVSLGFGHSGTTLDARDYEGWFLQPEFTVSLPLTASKYGEWQDGVFYPNSAFCLDFRVGYRGLTLSALATSDPHASAYPDIGWGGGYISVGVSFWFK